MDDSIDVVGQTHRDPWLHGQFHVEVWKIKIGNEPNWHFAEARQITTDDWRSWGSTISTIDVNNGSEWPSSDGKLGKIYQS
jgi:hypothetical protein